ncbi:ABC1-domain-containing protein [Morchella conica CCBAS932]|uniref:ABC1-domain-containing protein n=1 Tax=Morchella conica CCBAS932 TaxID=1392247 RepID=A0A3N4L2L7_9PEZI|nr:ABC1-domain-containing protein [Morchella conica CCBAS932]
MLEESDLEREELLQAISKDRHVVFRIANHIKILAVNWVIEPIATGFRFVTLVTIFVPLILAIPLVYLGKRLPEKNNERQGTIWWYAFLIKSMEQAGPTFIKLGQWAASRTDIFPTEMCEMMSKLHSNARPHSLHETKRIISHAFGGRPFEDIFEEFDETPLGIGAIAQVYKAKLKPDFIPYLDDSVEDKGKYRRTIGCFSGLPLPHEVPSSYVAIKVLHPRVEKTVLRDLRIMAFFAALLHSVPTLEWLSFPEEVAQFSGMMRLQMDLRIEAANLSRFRSNFRDRATIIFPMPYSHYTTREVLIEEFAHGIPLRAFLECGAGAFERDISDMGLDGFLHMLIMDNFIHADLHPGNIMVRFHKPEPPSLISRFSMLVPTSEGERNINNHKEVTDAVLSRLSPYYRNPERWVEELNRLDAEGYRPQLVFIDTGLVTELNAKNRHNFLDLFRAVAEFDGYRAGHLMIERSRAPSAVIDKEIFALKMQHLVLAVKTRTLSLGNITIGDILSEVLQMVRVHHVRMEGDFINVILSILLLEGIGRSLDPGMDLLKRYADSDLSLPMLRSIGAGSGAGILGGNEAGRGADLSFLKVWLGLEMRQFLNNSIESVENLVKYDLLSPNI